MSPGDATTSSAWVRPKQKPDDEVIVFGMGLPSSENDTGALLGGRYRLLEVLGIGATATIYAGKDERTKASVAVKVLYKGAREAVGPFFSQEGRIAARYSNPHLVQAYDFGVDNERPFIVFTLVRGESLADMYSGELMPWRELFATVLQLLKGLASLHAQGIVHRDIKPDNVHVARLLGGDIHVTLLDVGYAWVPPERKITNAPVPESTVYGTSGFIAPEALAGHAPEPRHDIYSVGALMYKMLTSLDVPDLSAAPEMMCLPSPRAFVPTIPRSVDDLVMRALSDVEARHQSAKELMAALRAVLSAEDVTVSAASMHAVVDSAAAGPALEAVGLALESVPARVGAEVRPRSQAIDEAPTAIQMGEAVMAAPTDGSLAAATVAAAALTLPWTSVAVVPPRLDTAGEVPLPTPTGAWRPAPTRPLPARSALAGALVGSACMWFVVGGSPAVIANDSAPPDAAPTAAPDLGVVRPAAPPASSPVLDAPAEPAPSSPTLAAVPSRPSRSVRASSESTRSTTPAPRPSRVGAKVGTFAQAMAKLEGEVRKCAEDAKVTEPSATVRVRFGATNGAIDQVRLPMFPASHSFARCVDSLIREAAPPAGPDPISSHTFILPSDATEK